MALLQTKLVLTFNTLKEAKEVAKEIETSTNAGWGAIDIREDNKIGLRVLSLTVEEYKTVLQYII